MAPIQYIYLGICIYAVLKFRKILGRLVHNGIIALYHEPFQTDQESEYRNIRQGLIMCNNPELLEYFWDEISRFQDCYKGLIAEQHVSALLNLYEERERELTILN